MRLWGYPDSPMETRCKIAWPDRVGAVTMALGVLAALEYQQRTGRGQFIEAGMLEAQGSMMGPAILDFTVNGREWDAMGYREVLGEPYAPYGCYPCRGEDNWIIIACASDEEWQSMVSLIGKSSGPPIPNSRQKGAARSIVLNLIGTLRSGRVSIHLDRPLGCSKKPVSPPESLPLVRTYTTTSTFGERGHIVETEGQPWGKIMHHGLPGIPSLSAASAARPAPGLARTMIKYLVRSWD